MKAFIAVVVKRSNSRNCGTTEDEVVTKASREFLEHDLLGAFLMGRIEIGKQKADGDRFDARSRQFARARAHLVFRERDAHLAVRRHQPLGRYLAESAPDQRAMLPGNLLHDRIVLGR